MSKLKLTFPTFRCPSSVVTGAGALRAVAEVSPGTVFMLSASPDVSRRLTEVLAKVGASLDEGNRLTKPPGEPNLPALRLGAAFLNATRPARIVAIGGGSVLDWARLSWALARGILDETGELRQSEGASSRPEIWLVPTTCGTGAEAADVAVFTSAKGRKIGLVRPEFLADRVVLDGHFLSSLGRSNVASFLCDALSHGIEASLSLVPNEIAKHFAVSCVGSILGTDSSTTSTTRDERLMEAGFLGGVAAGNCSVGVIHAFAHSVGVDGVGHGLANACALLDGIRFNASTPQMQRLLTRLHLPDVESLLSAVRPIVSDALAGFRSSQVASALGDSRYRAELAVRMRNDVALRTNPRRASQEDLERFVHDVHTSVELLCPRTS
jgi:alcohol dehydrogenase class IV